MSSGIYTITNTLDGKMYVGYTFDFEKRETDHFASLRNGYHPNTHLQRAYNKYGGDCLKFEILEECDCKFLSSLEHYWATLLLVHNPEFGYNIRPTHPNGRVGQSAETRLKISMSRKGRFKGTHHTTSAETREKISRANKGRTYGEDTIKKMSLSKIGVKRTKDAIERTARGHWKPIYQCDMDGNIVREWRSSKEAQEVAGFNRCSIARCLGGYLNTCGGYKWIRKV